MRTTSTSGSAIHSLSLPSIAARSSGRISRRERICPAPSIRAASVAPEAGQLRVVFAAGLDAAPPLRRVLDSVDARQRISRRVCLNTGESSLHAAATSDDFEFDDDNLIKVFGPGWRLLIIGAGELARRVAQLALTLDYAVTICDSRPEYASGWEVDGTEFITVPPAELIAGFAPDSHSAVLALAHAPVLEDKALAAALKTDAFYIGALG